jgi:hypothetical protein
VALTRPGKILATLVTLVVVIGGGLFAYTKLTGKSIDEVIGNSNNGTGDVPKECPLTGLKGDVPDRPVLAVKIENAPAARPQAGLEKADIVYEEPVEGGLTRFIAIFQCQDADRLGPIRSTRLVDGDIVRQFKAKGSQPLFAHSGGIKDIVAMIPAAGLLDVGFDKEPSAYERDPNRVIPHNLYSSTTELYAAAGDPTGAPPAMFNYDSREPTRAKPGTNIHVPFATDAPTDTDVFWKWNEGKGAYFRRHGDTPHKVESGQQISAKNVIVQFVQTRPSGYYDVNGVPVEEIGATGQGRAIVFRNGKAIEGTWVRQFVEDRTVFKDSQGREIDLVAGNTWVELVPESRVEATFS